MTTRWQALWLASAAAILPQVAFAATSVGQAPVGVFAPPQEPMVLTRTLRRPLPDGKEVITLRTYLVRFTPENDRIRVDGQLLAVTVDAPPVLQAMVEIERNRPDTGMFPMWLDQHGMLLPGDPLPPASAAGASVAHVLARISTLELPAEDSAQAQAFTSRLRNGAGRTPWPRDLFRPVAGARQDSRMIPLPDGRSGNVTIDTQASVARGMLASFTRKVTTDLGGDTRVTIEEWHLIDAPK